MLYGSTRGAAPAIDFVEAMLRGLAPDGDFYTPSDTRRLPASKE